jgi:hypothetical protein
MVKISFSRFYQYEKLVFVRTAKDMWGYMRKLTTDFVNVILPIVAYFILVYLGSLGLLQVEQINQLTNPLGDYAQILAVTVMILLSYVAGSIFITPMKLYYEQKKEADRHNWNNVYFGEILPAHRNLLGLALVITNEKMTPIENLSVWLVGISPSSTGNVAKGKRIGYVEHYETDKEPIFSDVNFLDTDREAVFPFSNYDEQDRFVLTLQSGARNTSPIELIKNGGLTGAYVLDFEFRAKGFEPKIIRYTLINNEDGLTFDKYEIKGHKKFKK